MTDGRDTVLMKKTKDPSLLSNFNQLLLTFHYDQQEEIDFLAVYKLKEPEKYGLVYFGEPGSVDADPYILLENDPHDKLIRIAEFSNIDSIWFILLDYDSVLNSAPPKMSDGLLNVADDLDNEHNFELSFNNEHNMYVVGKVSVVDSSTRFFKLEDSYKLEKFEKLSDLLDKVCEKD